MSDNKQAYISQVHLKGYKSIKDLTIDFKPGLNVVIGPNGSGKTNFLEIIDKLVENDFSTIDAPFNCAFVGSNENGTIEYKVKGFYASNNSEENLAFNFEEIIILNKEILYREIFTNFKNKRNTLLQEGNEHIAIDSALSSFFTQFLKYSIPSYYNYSIGATIYVKEIVNNSKRKNNIYYRNSDKPSPSISFIFKGIREQIEHSNIVLDQNNIKKLILVTKSFNDLLKKYTQIEEVKVDENSLRIVKNEEEELVIDNIVVQFKINGSWFYWNSLSDGTKRIFYLVESVFSYPNKYGDRRFILLEEPELGIHPDQLYKLMDFLVEQSKEKQIIITTHSPEVLNAISPDELDRIIVTRFDAKKGTIMRKLSPDKAKEIGERIKKSDMFLSDHWVHQGLEDDIFNSENDENQTD
jgi:predicted ATP-dependent endonuclease of OLD family